MIYGANIAFAESVPAQSKWPGLFKQPMQTIRLGWLWLTSLWKVRHCTSV